MIDTLYRYPFTPLSNGTHATSECRFKFKRSYTVKVEDINTLHIIQRDQRSHFGGRRNFLVNNFRRSIETRRKGDRGAGTNITYDLKHS